MYLMANLATQDGATDVGQNMKIDYIRAYSNDGSNPTVAAEKVSAPDGKDPGMYGATAKPTTSTTEATTGSTGTTSTSTNSTSTVQPATSGTTSGSSAGSTSATNIGSGGSATGSATPPAAQPTNVNVVIAGDSVGTADYSGSDPWKNLELGAPYTVKNHSVSGITLDTQANEKSAEILADFDKSGSSQNVLVIQDGPTASMA
jgi:hypothetical protein